MHGNDLTDHHEICNADAIRHSKRVPPLKICNLKIQDGGDRDLVIFIHAEVSSRWVRFSAAFVCLSVCQPRHQTDIVNGAHPGAGAHIDYTRAMFEHRCFPKRRLSTHTMHFRRVTGWIRVSVTQPSTPASLEYRAAIWSNFYLATQIEHDQSSYFCRGPDEFCWGPAPVGPTLVTGPPSVFFRTISQKSLQLRLPNVKLKLYRLCSAALELTTKAPFTPATMSERHCRMLQVERLLRQCCWCGRGLTKGRINSIAVFLLARLHIV